MGSAGWVFATAAGAGGAGAGGFSIDSGAGGDGFAAGARGSRRRSLRELGGAGTAFRSGAGVTGVCASFVSGLGATTVSAGLTTGGGAIGAGAGSTADFGVAGSGAGLVSSFASAGSWAGFGSGIAVVGGGVGLVSSFASSGVALGFAAGFGVTTGSIGGFTATTGGFGSTTGVTATTGGFGATLGGFGSAAGFTATTGGFGSTLGFGATTGGFGSAAGFTATTGGFGVDARLRRDARLDRLRLGLRNGGRLGPSPLLRGGLLGGDPARLAHQIDHDARGIAQDHFLHAGIRAAQADVGHRLGLTFLDGDETDLGASRAHTPRSGGGLERDDQLLRALVDVLLDAVAGRSVELEDDAREGRVIADANLLHARGEARRGHEQAREPTDHQRVSEQRASHPGKCIGQTAVSLE